jgi:3',5'-nucleoside bisphosphate phosphatase
LIDLHLHTTASDGRLTPSALVARVAAAGITVMSVTDHDTVAGLGEVRAAATAARIELVDGIEITSVWEGRDVHLLGYFIDPDDAELKSFLAEQRLRRVNRAREIGARLARLGMPVNLEALLQDAADRPGASLGRPAIARALVAAGYVESVQQAFELFLGSGRPAFVPRTGESPPAVVERIHAAGGVASMAHPGVTKQPAVMAFLADSNLDAIEVYHSDHSTELQLELSAFAEARQMWVTGGSDFHGDDLRGRPLGHTTLPRSDYDRLRAAARRS